MLTIRCRISVRPSGVEHEGEVSEGARAHLQLAQGIASGDEAQAMAGAEQLMEYLERFARRIIDR